MNDSFFLWPLWFIPSSYSCAGGADCGLDGEWDWELLKVKSGCSFLAGLCWALITLLEQFPSLGWDGIGEWWRPLKLVLLPEVFTKSQPSATSSQTPWKFSIFGTKSSFPAPCALIRFIHLPVLLAIFWHRGVQWQGWGGCWGQVEEKSKKEKSLVLGGGHSKPKQAASKKVLLRTRFSREKP